MVFTDRSSLGGKGCKYPPPPPPHSIPNLSAMWYCRYTHFNVLYTLNMLKHNELEVASAIDLVLATPYSHPNGPTP